VLSTGASLKYAVSENHIFFEKDYDVASMPIWGMDLKQEAYNSLKLYSEIIVIEDHLVDGGFGSWILESFNQFSENDTSIKLLGLDPKVTNMVGDQDYLNKVGWGL
jgi:transketolase